MADEDDIQILEVVMLDTSEQTEEILHTAIDSGAHSSLHQDVESSSKNPEAKKKRHRQRNRGNKHAAAESSVGVSAEAANANGPRDAVRDEKKNSDAVLLEKNPQDQRDMLTVGAVDGKLSNPESGKKSRHRNRGKKSSAGQLCSPNVSASGGAEYVAEREISDILTNFTLDGAARELTHQNVIPIKTRSSKDTEERKTSNELSSGLNKFAASATNENWCNQVGADLNQQNRSAANQNRHIQMGANGNQHNRSAANQNRHIQMGANGNQQNRSAANQIRQNGASSQANSASKRQNNTASTYRKNMKPFDTYWNKEELSHGLKRGQIIQGPIRINPRNFEEAYVPHPDGKSDIFLSGTHDRNRALNGDIVYVQISPKDCWKLSIEDINDREKELVTAFEKVSLAASVSEGTSTKQQEMLDGRGSSSSKTHNRNVPQKMEQNSNKKSTPMRYASVKDLAENGNSLPVSSAVRRLFHDDDRVDQSVAGRCIRLEQKVDLIPGNMVIRTGKVVGIAEQKHSRACTGRLKLMADRSRDNALFSPADHRLPRLVIPSISCPAGFFERPQDFENTLFVARIKSWEANSQFAMGELARSLGEAGEIEPETEGILMENDIDCSEFSEEVLSCLPQELPWIIPADEYANRRDLTKECIFTIDPTTARDLDDALSCELLEDGTYEVGVHIADVSYFVKPKTDLDDVASSRSTSVYLVQKVIPMLPRLLCEQLCSLNPDEARLTFSVIWKINERRKISEEWFGRTIIRSCVKLGYNHAQGFIDDPERKWSVEELPPISTPFTSSMIRDRVLNLNKIAVNLRNQRFDNGALRLDQVKLQFHLDKESGLPSGWSVYEQKDSNRLVEEFMLLANMAVAHKIQKSFPEFAVLRRHPPPQNKMLDDLEATCSSLGVPIDASSAGALQRSILTHASCNTEDAASKLLVLINICSRPMQNARYFCTGTIPDESEWHHYALNVPLYTHFTSPIRRYPDIMVHRLLAASLEYKCEGPETDSTTVENLCVNSNDKKVSAKRVSDLSSEMFFSVFVKECGPIEERGMVMSVLDHSFDVLILKLGVVKRAYCDKLPLASHSFNKIQKRAELELVWSATDEHPKEVKQSVTVFTSVSCRLVSADEPLKWNLEIKHPSDIHPTLVQPSQQ